MIENWLWKLAGNFDKIEFEWNLIVKIGVFDRKYIVNFEVGVEGRVLIIICNLHGKQWYFYDLYLDLNLDLDYDLIYWPHLDLDLDLDLDLIWTLFTDIPISWTLVFTYFALKKPAKASIFNIYYARPFKLIIYMAPSCPSYKGSLPCDPPREGTRCSI